MPEIIGTYWPELKPHLLWDRKQSRGFATIPKTMPLVMRIIDCLCNGKPAGNTYLSLWSNTFDLMLVEVKNEMSLAIESGFSGARAVGTWKSRMNMLEKLGFISSRSGNYGTYSHVLIYDPHIVIRRIKQISSISETNEVFINLYIELLNKNSLLRGSYAFDVENTNWKDLAEPKPSSSLLQQHSTEGDGNERSIGYKTSGSRGTKRE